MISTTGGRPWPNLPVVETLFPEDLVKNRSDDFLISYIKEDYLKGFVPSLQTTKLPPPASSAMADFAGGVTLLFFNLILCPFGYLV